MNMVSMKLEPQEDYPEARASQALYGEGMEYPCGLCLYLTEEQVAKLGLEGVPEVGDSLMLQAKVQVKRTNVEQDGEGPERRIELQITDMSIES